MTDETMMVYRAGTFTTEPAPLWMMEIHAAAAPHNNWDDALTKVLGNPVSSTKIEEQDWIDGCVMAWRTPGGGFYVEMIGGEQLHADVWLPDPVDWLPFNAAYGEPFLQTRAAIRQISALDRLTNALVSYMRHGQGRHIDRGTGESRIDQQEDRERHGRDRAALRASNLP